MKKNKDNSQKQRKENVYIVLPTLDVMLSACDNCKLKAHFANMEYSNFMKHCKMQTDLRIDTYARCASAFGMDMLIVHIPTGMIGSAIETTLHKSKKFYTIEPEDLIVLLNKLCRVEQKRVVQHFIHFLYKIEAQANSPNDYPLSDFIIDFLSQFMEKYGE